MRFLGQLLFLATATTVLGEPEARFWFLRTDHGTAVSLQKAVVEALLPDEELEEKISSLVSQKSIEELGKFEAVVSPRMPFEVEEGQITIKEIGEAIPMGLKLEAGAHVQKGKKRCDLRIALDYKEKAKRHEYAELHVTNANVQLGERWQWYHHWRRGDQTTVLLTKVDSYPVDAEDAELSNPVLYLKSELLAVRPADLERFGKSTAATREKAITWLRGQGEVLDGTRLICRSGERAIHQNRIQRLHEKNDEWDTWSLGSSLDLAAVIGAGGEEVDIRLELEWQDPDDPQPEPEYRFEIGKTFEVGGVEVLHPQLAPEDASNALVLLIETAVEMPATEPIKQVETPVADGVYVRTYVVAPKFTRVLQEALKPGERSSIKELLTMQGMGFPDKTSAHFMSSKCIVILRHEKSGHEAFESIIKLVEQSE